MQKDTVMITKSTVLNTIAQVAAEQHKHVPSLTDGLPLLDSGLDSLSLAIIVARLEEELGVDPFTMAGDAPFPVTIGDLVALYEQAVASESAPVRTVILQAGDAAE